LSSAGEHDGFHFLKLAFFFLLAGLESRDAFLETDGGLLGEDTLLLCLLGLFSEQFKLLPFGLRAEV